MSQQLNPYLTFDGQCADAMALYARVLGGEPRITTFRDVNMDIDGVMHAELNTPTGMHLFASDRGEGMPELKVGNNVQVSLSGTDLDALSGYFSGLADGGQVLVPLEEQMWGDRYGQLVDRYGIIWHVNVSS